MDFSQERYEKYEKENWPNYERIKVKRGHALIQSFDVELGYTPYENLKMGDGEWLYKNFIYRSDLKICGTQFNCAIKRNSIENGEFDAYDFYDPYFAWPTVYVVSKKKINKAYSLGSYYIDPKDENANNNLVRFDFRWMKSVATIELQ